MGKQGRKEGRGCLFCVVRSFAGVPVASSILLFFVSFSDSVCSFAYHSHPCCAMFVLLNRSFAMVARIWRFRGDGAHIIFK